MNELQFKYTTFLMNQNLTANNLEEYDAIVKELVQRGFFHFDVRGKTVIFKKFESTHMFTANIHMSFWKTTELKKVHFIGSGYETVKIVFVQAETNAEAFEKAESMYDCTGQPFVSSIRFAHMRDNIYLVRITWGIDV